MEIEASKIVSCATLGSKYDNDSIVVQTDDGSKYRIKADEVLKAFDGLVFRTIPMKRKGQVHTYLEVLE